MGMRHASPFAPENARRGQATVELAVAIPMLIVLAAISFNVMTFFGDCTSFDRQFRNAVRVYASSPTYDDDLDQVTARIQAYLEDALPRENLSVTVDAYDTSNGLTMFEASLDFAPNLFGQSMREEFFGITLPHAVHTDTFAIDAYGIGVQAWAKLR